MFLPFSRLALFPSRSGTGSNGEYDEGTPIHITDEFTLQALLGEVLREFEDDEETWRSHILHACVLSCLFLFKGVLGWDLLYDICNTEREVKKA